MDYVFDFEHSALQFPGRVKGEGKIPLHITFYPFNLRDKGDGEIAADYLVMLERTDGKQSRKWTADVPDFSEEDPSAAQTHEQPVRVDEPVDTPATRAVPISAGANDPQTATARFITTLHEVSLPAVVLDNAYHIHYANDAFRSSINLPKEQTLQGEFFGQFTSDAARDKQLFETAKNHARGNAFQLDMSLKGFDNLAHWDVFIIKDADGHIESYGLLSRGR